MPGKGSSVKTLRRLSFKDVESLISMLDSIIHMRKYTLNEWKRFKTTLETRGKIENYTRNEWRRYLESKALSILTTS